MAVQNISESLYVGMCLKIGTPQQVASRRDIRDIVEMLEYNEMLNKPFTAMLSGSRREGLDRVDQTETLCTGQMTTE